MKRRLLIILLCLLPLVLTWAKPRFGSRRQSKVGSEVEFSLGAGWSYINYRPLDVQVSNNISYALKAHLGYNYFFNQHVGVGFGVDVARYGTTLALPSQLTWEGVYDSAGERYTHITTLDRWRERHQALYAEIPLGVSLVFPVGKLRLRADIGAKYCFSILANSTASGGISHTGYYDQYHLTLYETPPYGFYTENNFAPRSDLQFMPGMVSVYAKLGVTFPITKQLDLTAKLYLDYGVTNVRIGSVSEQSVGFRNDRVGMESIHYFMNDYTNLTNTNLLGTEANPLALGFEVGVSYFFSKKKRGCNCIRGSKHRKPAFRPKRR